MQHPGQGECWELVSVLSSLWWCRESVSELKTPRPPNPTTFPHEGEGKRPAQERTIMEATASWGQRRE